MTVPNVLVSVSGLAKSGKSHLALTFPAPMVFHSLDIGLKPVLRKFPDKVIDVKTYPIPVLDSVKATGLQKEISKVWNSLSDAIKVAAEDTTVVTQVVDTWTVAYLLARIARAYELKQENLLQFQYGDVYARLRSLIHHCSLAGQNLVLTSYLRDRWIGDQNTGEKDMDGWAGTETEVDLILWVRADAKIMGKEKRNVNITTVKANRYDRDLNGQEFVDTTYEDLVALLGV